MQHTGNGFCYRKKSNQPVVIEAKTVEGMWCAKVKKFIWLPNYFGRAKSSVQTMASW